MSSHVSGEIPNPDTETPAERASRVARVRSEIDAGIWVVIWLSLAFTAINVQIFAARGAEMWSLAWCAAWLLDPMVSILVLVVVRAEQITSRWQVQLGRSITATKWGCFVATYAMNTWSSWVEQSPSMIVLHSVPPAMMLLAAEVGPRIRDGLTRAVLAANTQSPTAEQAGRAVNSGGVAALHTPPGNGRAPAASRVSNPRDPSKDTASTPGHVADPGPSALPVGPLPSSATSAAPSTSSSAPTSDMPGASRAATPPAEELTSHERRSTTGSDADPSEERRPHPGASVRAEPSLRAADPDVSHVESVSDATDQHGTPSGVAPPPAASDPGERNERVWRLAHAMLRDAQDQGLAGRDEDGGIAEDAWSGTRVAAVLGGSRRNGQRLVVRAATLARALQHDNPPTPPRGIALELAVRSGDDPVGDDVDTDPTTPDDDADDDDDDDDRGPSRLDGPDLHVVGRAR